MEDDDDDPSKLEEDITQEMEDEMNEANADEFAENAETQRVLRADWFQRIGYEYEIAKKLAAVYTTREMVGIGFYEKITKRHPYTADK